MPMMGRGSDTRMYAPRSESDTMYSSANEGETKYNPTSPQDKDERNEKKKLRAEEKKERRDKIKHLKIRASQGIKGEESSVAEDDGNKQDDEREMGLQGGPAGSRGNLLDLATGAKSGTGSAMTGPLPIAMSEPMDSAWSSLLKESVAEYNKRMHYHPKSVHERASARKTGFGSRLRAGQPERIKRQMEHRARQSVLSGMPVSLQYAHQDFPDLVYARTRVPPDTRKFIPRTDRETRTISQMGETGKKANIPADHLFDLQRLTEQMLPQQDFTMEEKKPFHEEYSEANAPQGMVFDSQGNLIVDPRKTAFDVQTGEPMDYAWSSLLKRDTPNKIQSRRRREKRQEFRPSTGQFKRPPGGMNPAGSTMRRFRARMRGIKGSKKTGLMKPHLSVEMSHRGIATKQPMSKDPQKYRQYMGQSEARKILGNVRSSFSPHARYGERSVSAGPTGAGRIGGLLAGQSGQMNRPSLRQIGIRRPRIRRPRNPVQAMQAPMGVPSQPMQAPSSISSLPQPSAPMMMSEERAESELLKGRTNSLTYHKLNLLRRLIRAQERAEKLGKSMQGTRSAMENGHIPSHPAGVHQHEDEDEKNDGPTQNLETNSSRLGLDPAGYLTSKRGHMG